MSAGLSLIFFCVYLPGKRAEVIANDLHILPDLAFFVRIAKQICRMERRHHLCAEIVMKSPAQLADRRLCLKQILRRRRSQNDNHLRSNDGDLSQQEWFTDRTLV